jgi:hypothetical protein
MDNPLAKLELDSISKSDRQNILDYLDAIGFKGESEFIHYLKWRFFHKMPTRNFENFARNIFNYDMPTLKDHFANFMANAYLMNDFESYFQRLVVFDKRRFAVESLYSPELDIVMAVVHRIIYHVSHGHRLESALPLLQNLSKDTSIKYQMLLLLLGEQYYVRGDKVRVLLMIDKLDYSDRYELLAMSLLKGSSLFVEIQETFSEDQFREYVQQHMKDNDTLCRTIRTGECAGHLCRSSKLGNHQLLRTLIENAEAIPETLEHLLKTATDSSYFDIVIQLGCCFPKKRILEIIASQNDPDLLDKFFFLYKDYPEVKKLAPFI